MESYIYETLKWMGHWVELHPRLVGLTIFLVAAGESLFLVGIIVPGATFMVVVGVLVGMGKIELMPALLWAMTGAIAGDGISYWIGYYFRDRLATIWPMRRYPALLQRGQFFFEKHGGKSIVFGRFFGPVRAVIPTIAGMLGMKPLRFSVVNVLSAIAWAPAVIIPGLVVGAAVELASEIALRLVVVLVVTILALWLTLWLVRHLIHFLQAHTHNLTRQVLTWSSKHPVVGPYTRAILEPNTPSYKALVVSASILLVASAVLVLILSFGAGVTGNRGINITWYNFFQSLRTPIGDQIMVFFTLLGDAWVYLPVLAATLLWFWYRKHYAAVIHALFAAGVTAILIPVLKLLTQSPRPENFLSSYNFSFPSGHVTIALAVYGFTTVLIANGLKPQWRSIPYITTSVLMILIGMSRLYLGVHWLVDVLGGMLVALIWLSITGISYQRHLHNTYPARGLIAVVVAVATLAVGTHLFFNFNKELKYYERRYHTTLVTQEDWWREGWQRLPAIRLDIRHRQNQPLTVQYAGDLNTLRASLENAGWKVTPEFKLMNALHWLHPTPNLSDLPVLPQVHHGRHEKLRMTLPLGEEHYVLRLWTADHQVIPSKVPLYLGNVSIQRIRKPLGFFSLSVTHNDFQSPFLRFSKDINSQVFTTRRTQRQVSALKTLNVWDGQVILITPRVR